MAVVWAGLYKLLKIKTTYSKIVFKVSQPQKTERQKNCFICSFFLQIYTIANNIDKAFTELDIFTSSCEKNYNLRKQQKTKFLCFIHL